MLKREGEEGEWAHPRRAARGTRGLSLSRIFCSFVDVARELESFPFLVAAVLASATEVKYN